MRDTVSLSPRLSACARLVRQGGILCDVGTDHACLCANLLQRGVIPHAIATDIHRQPLEAAARTLTAAGVRERCTLVCCDGVSGVTEPFTELVIAGMGGETIVHILSAWAAQGIPADVHMILQPMTKAPALRQYLAGAGWHWTEEAVVEARVYLVFDVTGRTAPYTLSDFAMQIGSPAGAAAAYYAAQKRRLERRLEGLGTRPEAAYWRGLLTALENAAAGQISPDAQWV